MRAILSSGLALLAGACTFCESLPDPCQPNPCTEPHRTRCQVSDAGRAECACDEGYELRADGSCRAPCDPNPCTEAHRTRCEVVDGRAVCACDEGYADYFADGRCLSSWIPIEGGSFEMGSPEGEGVPAEHPQHRVRVPAFEIERAEVSVAQYRRCVQAGACSPPAEASRCNWPASGREAHPINCVSHQQASQYCAWIGGRLPTEAEWEYAARSAGEQTYPWGAEAPSCERAVFDEPASGGDGCGAGSTRPVCSALAGLSAQGLCDLAGNVYEWVADAYHPSYEGAPEDGSAWLEPDEGMRVRRGGAYDSAADTLRAAYRNSAVPAMPVSSSGLRCARDPRR
ncbi:MAG: formylglycine-generating enzyme family protein [Deltaproteobacteria bacterium]|nr:formylglycine-generating enzyme family protein [Deltaproteobacteria bacterium]